MGSGISVHSNINIVVTKQIINDGVMSTKNEKTRTCYAPLSTVTTDDLNIVQYSGSKSIAIVLCNSYDNTPYALGDCAKNDGVLAYNELMKNKYEHVLVYHDLRKCDVLQLLDQCKHITCDKLLIYYIGHGTQTYTPYSKFEKTGMDSAFVCVDGLITDNALNNYFIRDSEHNCKQVRLISDCCHSGTIYDLTSDDYNKYNTVSISACYDNQTAKQDYICKRGNGVFSYYFWKYFNPDITLEELLHQINSKLSIYNQHTESSVDNIISKIDKQTFNIL